MDDSCNIFTTEYRAEFTPKKHKKISIYVPFDCYTKQAKDRTLDPEVVAKFDPGYLDKQTKEGTVDLELAGKLDPRYLDKEALIRRAMRNRMQSVYRVDYKNPQEWSKKLWAKTAKQVQEEKKMLNYLIDLYMDEEDTEDVFTQPKSYKRVLGYANPKPLGAYLTTYQNTHEREAARMMMASAASNAQQNRRSRSAPGQ